MERVNTRRTIAAGAIGNVLEWYDFAIYGYFATAIGRTFFPHEDPVAQVLAAFGVFAVGFLMRPVGGALVGMIGDKFGRRAALTFSVTAMAIPTFLVGILPGYQSLGVMAPILLTLLRMIQGLSVGGEYTTSNRLHGRARAAREARIDRRDRLLRRGRRHPPRFGHRRGARGGPCLPRRWRSGDGAFPFLIGLAVGFAGYLLRRHVQDPPKKAGGRSPLGETLRNHGGLLARLAGLSAFNAVSFYLIFVYIVSWLQLADGIAPKKRTGNQHDQHDRAAGGHADRRSAQRSLWPQAAPARGHRPGLHWAPCPSSG